MAGIYDTPGESGLNVFSGQVLEDFLREFHGRLGYKRYNEMRLNSPIIGALLLAIENAVRAVKFEWTSDEAEAAKAQQRAQDAEEAARIGQADATAPKPKEAKYAAAPAAPEYADPRLELLEASLAALSHSLHDHISEALTFLPFGFAPFAIWYQRDERGRVLWRKFLLLGQDTVHRWELDAEGGLVGMWQQAAPAYTTEFIPIERMILYRARVEKNNPEGRSILRQAWIPYYYAKNIAQIEAIGVERDLAGLPVMTPPASADLSEGGTDSTLAQKIVRNIRRDEQEGVVLPPGWTLELLSTGGSRQFDTDKIIHRYDTRILQSALAQFLMLGQDGVGSLALSKDQTDFFTMAVNTVADIICDALTKYAAPRLLALNGLDAEGVRCQHTPAGDMDLTALSEFLSKTGTYITWTPQDEVWLRQVARLPERSPQELAQAQAQKQQQELAKAQALRPPETAPGKGDAKMRAEWQAALMEYRAAMAEHA